MRWFDVAVLKIKDVPRVYSIMIYHWHNPSGCAMALGST